MTKIKNMISQVASFVWSKKTVKFLFCIIFTFVLLIFNYKWSNKSITHNEEEKFVTQIGVFLNKYLGLRKTNPIELEDVILINISNDKELIHVNDELGIPKGNLDITDREKLASFLKATNNNHKFILLDVIFDSIHRSKNDSSLQKSLSLTKNILVPSVFKDDDLNDPFFDSITTGISAYKKSIYTNRFVKYSFYEKDTLKSIALKMAEYVLNSDVNKEGLFYYDNGDLCLNSIILDHKIKPVTKYNGEGVQNFYDLGVDILQSMSGRQIQNLIRDKVVLIGDFEDRNLHPTIYGEMQGIIINYNAFLALKYKKHIVPKSLILLLLIAYLIIIYIIAYYIDIKIVKKTKRRLLSYKMINQCSNIIKKFKLKNVIVHFIGSYFKISFLVTVISLLCFLIYGIHIEILRSSLVFGTLIVIRDWWRNKSNKKDTAHGN